MIEVVRQAAPEREVRYVGFDLFEAAPQEGRAISLRSAHQLLRAAGAKVQLVPGDPAEMLVRMANSLGTVDVLILPADLDAPSQARLWRFVPRMLGQWSDVFIDSPSPDGGQMLHLKPRSEIDAQAAAVLSRRAA